LKALLLLVQSVSLESLFDKQRILVSKLPV